MDTSSLSIVNGERARAERASRSTVQGSDEVERSGPEHVLALLKMGALKQDAGDYPEAEDLFRRALELGERVLGPENPAIVAALTSLAGARILCGKPESAEPLVIRALSITENGPGATDPDFAILVNDLARLCLKQSAHAVAEPLLLRLLAMKRSKGDDHPEVATVLASLAAVRQALGRHESAEQLWRRVLEIRERTLAPNHFGIVTALERLADSCSARGKIGEAVGLFQRALTIRELTLGAGNPSLRVSRDKIADLQLQASEESLDPSAVESPSPAPEKYRFLSADNSVQSASRPVKERSTATVRSEKATTEPRKVTAIATVIEIAPTKAEIEPQPKLAIDEEIPRDVGLPSRPEATAFAMPLPVDEVMPEHVELQPELVNYRDVILSIQQEMEDEENASPKAIDRVRELLAPIMVVLKQRQKEIAVAAGAIVLVAGLTTASQALIKSQQAGAAGETTALPGTRSVTTSSVAGTATLATDRTKAPVVASAEATPVAPSSRARVVDHPSQIKKPTDRKGESTRISIPSVSAGLMAGFDSVVRAHSEAGRDVGESFPLQPPPMTVSPQRGSFVRDDQVIAPQRAQLIGSLPTPRVPAPVADVQGEVRVRFDVDTSGRPVMSSLSVVNSPNSMLTAAVVKLIPGLRFEPARSGGADPKPVVDVVQLGFNFRPTK